MVFNGLHRWSISRTISCRPLLDAGTSLTQDLAELATSISHMSNHTGSSPLLRDQVQRLQYHVQQIDRKTAHIAATLSTTRTRRAWFNAVGSALQVIAGTLTEADLQVIQNTSAALRAQQLNLAHVVDKQLSMLNSTTAMSTQNSVSITQLRAAALALSTQFDKLQRQQTRTTMQFQADANLTATLTAAESAYLEYSQHLDNFLEAFDLLVSGKLSNYFLSASEILNTLGAISATLPAHLDLPASPVESSLLLYHSLFETAAAISPAHELILAISFPLKDMSQTYQLYHFYPSPVLLHGNLYKVLNPPQLILAMSPDRQEFLELTPAQLRECKPLVAALSCVVKETTPAETPSCLAALFLRSAAAESLCQFNVLPAPITVAYELQTTATWAYFSSQEYRLQWKCPPSVKRTNLPNFIEQAGSIVVPPFCSVRLGRNILHGRLTGSFTKERYVVLIHPLERIHSTMHAHVANQLSNMSASDSKPVIERLLRERPTNYSGVDINVLHSEVSKTIDALQADKASFIHLSSTSSAAGASLVLICIGLAIVYRHRRSFQKAIHALQRKQQHLRDLTVPVWPSPPTPRKLDDNVFVTPRRVHFSNSSVRRAKSAEQLHPMKYPSSESLELPSQMPELFRSPFITSEARPDQPTDASVDQPSLGKLQKFFCSTD